MHLLALVSVDFSNRFSCVVSFLLESFDLSIFDTDILQELVKIDAAHQLHLLCYIFKLSESFDFGFLKLLQLMLLELFKLNLVFKSFENAIECGNF